MNARLKIEVECADCSGSGKQQHHLCPVPDFECPGKDKCGEVQTVTCSECDGSGFIEKYISINLHQFINRLGSVKKKKG